MYNPDHYYEAHALRLKELSEEANYARIGASLTRRRRPAVRGAIRRLGLALMALGAWLARSGQRDEQLS